MDLALTVITYACLAVGCFFSLTGAVGLLRMPDFYTRLHPAGKNDTLGVLFIVTGLLAETLKYDYGFFVGAKLLLVVLFVFLTAPAATHALTQAAFLEGLRPWGCDTTDPALGGEQSGSIATEGRDD